MDETENSSIMRVVKKIAKTKLSSLAVHKLEQIANKVGVEEKELFQLYVEAKNRSQIDSFAATPYNERGTAFAPVPPRQRLPRRTRRIRLQMQTMRKMQHCRNNPADQRSGLQGHVCNARRKLSQKNSC